MKNKLILFIMLLCIPFMINAKEYCKIVNGNLNKLGSEIACGDEHFYIVESKEDTIKMLTKYNLETGYLFDKVILSEERYNEIVDTCGSFNDECFYETDEYKSIHSKYENNTTLIPNYLYDRDVINENNIVEHHIIFSYYIYVDELKQSSEAIAAHGDEKGKPVFPEYGVVQFSFEGINQDEFNNSLYYDEMFGDFNMDELRLAYIPETQNTPYKLIKLNDYKDYLTSKGFEINNVDLMSFQYLNELVLRLSGSEIPYFDWYLRGMKEVNGNFGETYNIVGNIKELLPKGNDWLFNTTYWLKTSTFIVHNNDGEYSFSSSFLPYMLFVDPLGNMCVQNSCSIALGAGVRPVVELNKDNFNIYSIDVQSDSNGTIEVATTAVEGETIVYKPIPNEGYELQGLYIVTESGDRTDINKEDITVDENGNYTINPEKFKMPDQNIVIHVKWINNPKTGVRSIFMIIYGILLASICGYFVLKNNHIGL